MKFYDAKLTESQNMFLQLFLTQVGEHAIGEKLEVIHHGSRKYIRTSQQEIYLSLSDDEIIQMAQHGYLEIYSSEPVHIVITKLILEKAVDKTEKVKPKLNDTSPSLQLLKVDIIQVYAWLIACLIAGLLSLFLLFLTVQQVLAQNVNTTVGAGITTFISSILSAIFFRNYDKANEQLKYLRSLPDNNENQEIKK